MDAEDEAVRKLESMGYNILYRNLNVSYKKNLICEFDIVLSNCIVEVKSGKSVFDFSPKYSSQSNSVCDREAYTFLNRQYKLVLSFFDYKS